MKYILLIISFCGLALTAKIQDAWPLHYNGNILSIFTELQEKLKNGAPVDGINDMLNDIKQHVLEEGSKHTEVQDKQKEECTSEAQFRLKEIDDSILVRESSQSTLNRLDKRINQLLEELKYAKEELYRDETELEIKINRRRHQKEQNVKKIEDHNQAIVSLNECIEIIEEIYAGGESFIQLAQLSKSMIKHAVTLKQTKEYAPMLSILAQLAIQQDSMLADEQTLMRIKNFIKRVGDRIRQQKTQFMEIDQTDEDRYQGEKARLEGEIVEGKDFIEKTEEEIENVTQLIAESTAVNELAIAKIDLNKKLLDDVIKMCSTFNNEYEISVQKRLNEVQLIEQLLTLVEKKRSQLNEGIVQKGQKAIDKWDYFDDREKYEASDYEKFKE